MHMTTTWLPPILLILGVLSLVFGIFGIATDNSGDRWEALVVGAILVVVGLGLRAVGQRARHD